MNDEDIFHEALAQPTPSERAAYLDRACAGDPALRASVEALLRAAAGASGFLKSGPAVPLQTQDFQPVTEGPGTRIGPYKLLQQIGEGGMGVVYMAEQQQPLRRKVALKIIKPGLDSKQVSARFEAERQALALMDHQNIAKVLDAGTISGEPGVLTPGVGRPYFVMELVHGVPLTQYCDDHHLTPKQRLELFLPVCHAIQHAHQKGIIHRDLKPSNVLVCLYDGVPVPKVIDFGIAKATGQPLTERTMFTQFGTLVGTLEYMSPEQAELSQLGIDTRSDVYSLGVLLYELLTGTTPLQRPRLREAGFDEIRRLIREEEPPKPSTRLSTSGVALAAISAQRQTEPAKLTKLVRGELDWIVMKALEKDRNRRYETANGLARDVERYLHDEPVEACPPTASYKLRKFARKHKAGLASAAGFAALLVLGTAISAWQAVRATQAEAVANANAVQAQEKEQEANQQRNEAQQQRDEVKALNDKLAAKEQQLQRTLYAAHINLAQQAWEETRIPRMVELLERHRPKPGEPDLRGFEWHYLYRLSHSELLTLKGHTGGVSSVAYSPDGKRLASASNDKTVKVWDAQTGQELLSIKHTDEVWSVAFSPDGKRLAIGDNEGGVIRVWDAQTGQELLTLKDRSSCVAFSPDGKRLAYVSNPWDKTKNTYAATEVKVCDAQTGQELLTCKGHTAYIRRVAFSPDGKRLASASSVPEKMVKVWDAQTGQELLTFKGHTNRVTDVAFSPDGKRLASGENNGTVKVWDAQTGQELLTLKGHTRGVNVAFSPDGKRLASSGYDNTVKVWDAQTGQELRTYKGGSGGVAFSPDGRHLATAGSWPDPTVKVWDAQQQQESLTLKGHTGDVFSVAFSPDGKRLASASNDKTVKVGDVQTGQQTLTIEGHTAPVWSLAFSPDGKRLASGSGTASLGDVRRNPAELRVWDAQTGQELLTLLKGVMGMVYSVAFSPDGKRLAGAYAAPYPRQGGLPALAGTVKVWDAQTGQELLSIKEGSWHVAFSPDGKRLATASGSPAFEGTVKVWDAQTGQELLSIKHTGEVWSVAFSPDGKRLASVSTVGKREPVTDNLIVEVKVWDAQTGQELRTLQGGGGRVELGPAGRQVPRLALSPDGRRLVRGTKVWDAQTGEELLTLKVHTANVGSVFFSPDGHRLAGGGWDGTVTIWDATPLPQKP